MNDQRERGRSVERVRWRRVLAYCATTFGLSYAQLGGFLAAGGSFDDPSWLLWAQASSLTPALTAMVLCRFVWRDSLRDALALRFRPARWLVGSWLLAWLLILLALGLGLCMPGTRYDPSLEPAVTRAMLSVEQLGIARSWAASLGVPPTLLLVPFGIAASFTLSFVSGSGEEIGWRGLLHSELRPLGFWRNALLTGALWVCWHLPLIAFGYGFPTHPKLGIVLLSASLLVSSVGYAYVRERSGSALAVALLHGTTEAAGLLALAPIEGGSDLTVGVASMSWTLATAVVLVGLVVHDQWLAAEPILWPTRGRTIGARSHAPEHE